MDTTNPVTWTSHSGNHCSGFYITDFKTNPLCLVVTHTGRTIKIRKERLSFRSPPPITDE